MNFLRRLWARMFDAAVALPPPAQVDEKPIPPPRRQALRPVQKPRTLGEGYRGTERRAVDSPRMTRLPRAIPPENAPAAENPYAAYMAAHATDTPADTCTSDSSSSSDSSCSSSSD